MRNVGHDQVGDDFQAPGQDAARARLRRIRRFPPDEAELRNLISAIEMLGLVGRLERRSGQDIEKAEQRGQHREGAARGEGFDGARRIGHVLRLLPVRRL